MKSVKTLHVLYLIAAICIFFFASCSTEQAVFTGTQHNTDRIDISIGGHEPENINVQHESGSKSLVDYNFYGTGSHQFDIRLNLDAERTLVIKLVDDNSTDLWENIGGYSMYSTQDLDDKQQYVTVDLIDGSEVASFKSNIGDIFPRTASLNVFNILAFDPSNNELYGRITDMPLMSPADQKIITINGTFSATVNFLN